MFRTSSRYSLCLILVLFIVNQFLFAQTYKTLSEAKGLPVGAEAPMFKAKDQNDNQYDLKKALKKGPVVVLFYRGQWCPACNMHLSQLQDSLQQIYAAGATVIAISPERNEYLRKTAEKTKATFTLLHDKDYKIEEGFDVAFKLDPVLADRYNLRLDAQLGKAHSDSTNRFPIPATFIISKNGKIIWRHFNPDYRIRATVKDIVANIPTK